MSLSLGTVFWRDDPGGGHVYVVITPPSFPEVLIVNVSSNGPLKDQSCLLQPEDHPFLSVESVIAYEFAGVYPTHAVESALRQGDFVEKEPAPDVMMMKIWDGAFRTRRMNIRCMELLNSTIPH